VTPGGGDDDDDDGWAEQSSSISLPTSTRRGGDAPGALREVSSLP
jgi:hypothetical protein